MEKKYRHTDPQAWLDWLAWIGKQPLTVQATLEEFAGVTCYRLPHGEHVWIQKYEWVIPPGQEKADETDIFGPDVHVWVTVLQGRDSRFPGVAHSKVPIGKLTCCDCGGWMAPTKEQGDRSQAKYLEAQTIAAKKAAKS